MSPPWRRILLLKTAASLVGRRWMRPATIAGEPDFIHRGRLRLSMEGAQYFHAQKHLELASRYCDERKSGGLGGGELLARPYLVTFFGYLAFPTECALEKSPAGRDAMCSLPQTGRGALVAVVFLRDASRCTWDAGAFFGDESDGRQWPGLEWIRRLLCGQGVHRSATLPAGVCDRSFRKQARNSRHCRC
jgi:hypothetical protein